MTLFPVNDNGQPIFAVIPVDRYKRPLIEWKEFQTRLPSAAEIESWKSRFKERIAGWAMPCGQVSGIVALDFDGEEGRETLRKLALRPNVKTPSGSFHVWLEAGEEPVRTGAFDKRWPGMELKGDGGYVVVIGHNIRSAHKDEDAVIGDYEILDSTPTSREDLDSRLAGFVYAKKEANSDYAVARVVVDAIAQAADGRNNAGFWLACQLRDLGINKDEAWEILSENFYPQLPRGNHAYNKKELKASLDQAFANVRSSKTQAEEIWDLFNREDIEFWHAGDIAYVTLPSGESILVGSERMRNEIRHAFYQRFSKLADGKAVDTAISNFKTWGIVDGKEYAPNLRIAWQDGVCYVDLGDANFTIYAIDKTGYRKADEVPVKFIRTHKMGVLPEPETGGNLDDVKRFVNVHDDDWPLFKGLILSCFMEQGPYPVGVLVGQQGSAKSTSQSIAISLVDPRPQSYSERMGIPDTEKDLVVAAKNSRVLSWDNVSRIPDKVSDAIARLSTGGGMEYRTLYTNEDSTIFAQQRSVFINGIGDIVTRSDLLDRAIVLECPVIPDEDRIDEKAFMPEFWRMRPKIIGAIFDTVAVGIRTLPTVNVKVTQRMADFEKWGIACSISGFREAYTVNKNKVHFIAIESSPVGQLVKNLATKPNPDKKTTQQLIANANLDPARFEGCWFGTPKMIHEIGEYDSVASWDWPHSFKAFWNAFERVRPNLEAIGVRVWTFEKNHVTYVALKAEGRANADESQ